MFMRNRARKNTDTFVNEQNAINILKSESEEAAYRRAKENEFNPLNVLKEVLGFVFVVGMAFGWMMLMLLILSFVSLSYLHFNIDAMITFSTIFTIVFGTFYVFFRIRKSIKKEKR